MNSPKPIVAIASIKKSIDVDWLNSFRKRLLEAQAADQEILNAIDERLSMLSVGKPIAGMNFKERVWEAVRVYEVFLRIKHQGKNVKASRTRTMIKKWGEEEAVRRTVTNLDISNGLDLLAKHGRLDCAYEQIILDFPHLYDAATKAKAKANLARIPA